MSWSWIASGQDARHAGYPRHLSAGIQRRPVFSLANLKWRWMLARLLAMKFAWGSVTIFHIYIYTPQLSGHFKRKETLSNLPLNFRSEGGSRIRTWSNFDIFAEGMHSFSVSGSDWQVETQDPLPLPSPMLTELSEWACGNKYLNARARAALRALVT